MIAIAPTNSDWLAFLRERSTLRTVNFWTPTPWNVKRMAAGDTLYFLQKGTEPRSIVGYGAFADYQNMRVREAWDRFGPGNGCGTMAELLSRITGIAANRSETFDHSSNPEIGCIVLTNPVFLAPEQYASPAQFDLSFPSQVVKIKYFDRVPLQFSTAEERGRSELVDFDPWGAHRRAASVEDVRDAVRAFNRDVTPAVAAQLQRILPQTTYWVHEPTSGMFAPSKFAGLRDISHAEYAEALALVAVRGSLAGFDGSGSRNAIEQATGEVFKTSTTLLAQLRPWARRLVGGDPFEGVNVGKWRFLTLSGDRPTNDEPTHADAAADLEVQLRNLAALDAPRTAAARLEQAILRNHLFGGRTSGTCAICGEEFPVELLVAAHIKRRADCTDAEKRDRHNLMAACKFGCDELFERGYIVVVNGRITDGPRTPTTDHVSRRISYMRGKPCHRWTSANAGYFRAHALRVRSHLGAED